MSACKVTIVAKPHCMMVGCMAVPWIERTPDDISGMGNFSPCVGDSRKLWKDTVFKCVNILM